MTPYTPSLWSQAPVEATAWIGFNTKDIVGSVLPSWTWWLGSLAMLKTVYIDAEVHERPAAYKTPEQLIAEYRKEHGTEIEADAQTFFDSLTEDAQSSKNVLQIDHLLYDAAFHLAFFEKYLAAERARIEGEGK